MKIGEFAKKYGINPSAVRYYIDKALLSPKRENGQYSFDQTCVEQMDRIMRYKKCKFSLEEIEILSYYEGATNLKDKAVIREILQMFHEKAASIQREMESMEEVLQYLRQEIGHYQRLEESAQSQKQLAYVPLETLGLLHCPSCHGPLSLKAADLESRGVVRGELVCACGYRAVISDGMLLCEGALENTPFKAFENVDTVLAITDEFSTAYRTLIEKSHLWMYQQIVAGRRSIHTALAGPFSYNFLLKYMKTLPPDVLYVVVDISVRKLEKLKEYFSDFGKNILYIAGDIDKLPLKQESVDLYIDDFSGCNYIFTYNRELLGIVTPLMKRHGILLGHFVDYSRAPKSLENFRKDHEGFQPELMRLKKLYRDFSDAGIKLLEENNFGFPEGNQQDFVRNVSGEKVALIGYCGEKQT